MDKLFHYYLFYEELTHIGKTELSEFGIYYLSYEELTPDLRSVADSVLLLSFL